MHVLRVILTNYAVHVHMHAHMLMYCAFSTRPSGMQPGSQGRCAGWRLKLADRPFVPRACLAGCLWTFLLSACAPVGSSLRVGVYSNSEMFSTGSGNLQETGECLWRRGEEVILHVAKCSYT